MMRKMIDAYKTRVNYAWKIWFHWSI